MNGIDHGYMVRIIKNELIHFKNVDFGEVRYMNYSSVENSAEITQKDVVGIYGQNGSGKTALVEALDILKCVISGREIPYESYAGLLDEKGNTEIVTIFFLEYKAVKYKIKYELGLQTALKEKKINVSSEKLTYWSRGAGWKGERCLQFINPYYDTESILRNESARIDVKPAKGLGDIEFIHNTQSLAIYCAQKHISIFFNDLVTRTHAVENSEKSEEAVAFYDILRGLTQFGQYYFQVIKVSQLGEINKNIIPVNFYRESDNIIMHGDFPLVMNGNGRIPEFLYKQISLVIESINTALKAIIPNLRIELDPVGEELDENNNKYIQVEVYSIRDGHRFLTKYESEGIKRIISLLNYLISVYNYSEMCLVVDEMDSGIFEYLLGELLGVMNTEAKGQLIFTSHNLRAFEKLNVKNIICSTTNSENRYIRLTGVEKNHNPRDFYIRSILLGGQKEMLYDDVDLQSIGYAFRKACNPKKEVKLPFPDEFRKKLSEMEEEK